MNAVDKLISTAEAELGYLEKKSNKDLDNKTANAGSANYTKYNRDLKAWTGVGSISAHSGVRRSWIGCSSKRLAWKRPRS